MQSHDEGFRYRLESTNDFVVTFELVPGRTGRGRNIERVLAFAKDAANDGRLNALTLTDNPGGNPSLSPDELGREIASLGIETIVHMTCRDSNRLGLFSRAQQLDKIGVRNLLVLTGDYPAEDDSTLAKPCFDLDSVTLLCALNHMNKCREAACSHINQDPHDSTHFFLGAGVSCCKYTESEQLAQYYKLVRKVRNGAHFIVTQLGYDARKFEELLRFASEAHLDVPMLGTIYVLTEPAARFMNKGKVPGAHVGDKLYNAIAAEAQSEDRGRAASIERAAKLMAVLKGLGYRGVHLSGRPDYDNVHRILARFAEIENEWRDFEAEFDSPYENGFYLYEPQTDSDAHDPRPSASHPSLLRKLAFSFSQACHTAMFDRTAAWFPLLQKVASIADSNRYSRALYRMCEHAPKALLFGCRMCGDCALSNMAYVCPESRCPKFLRNGPCGGSSHTQCEVFPDRQCAWVITYERLKSAGLEGVLAKGCVPPRNWSLDQTSSWLNFYLGRDHRHITGPDCPCETENPSLEKDATGD